MENFMINVEGKATGRRLVLRKNEVGMDPKNAEKLAAQLRNPVR
jgi:hypothetical protein